MNSKLNQIYQSIDAIRKALGEEAECVPISELAGMVAKLSNDTSRNGYTTAFMFSDKENPDIPQETRLDVNTGLIEDCSGWSQTDFGSATYSMRSQSNAAWITFAIFGPDGSQKTEWSTPKNLKGEKGEKGADGIPGSTGPKGNAVEYIYTVDDYYAGFAPDSENVDGYCPEGWTLKPVGISDDNPTEWVSQRTKEGDTWGTFSKPVIWSKWGYNGKDGNGVEYIYCLTKTDDRPDLPTSDPDKDENSITWPLNGIWHDDPQPTTKDFPYCWASVRKQYYNGEKQIWGAYSFPTVWARLSKDGGRTVIIYTRDNNINAVINTPTKGEWNPSTNEVYNIQSDRSWSTDPNEGVGKHLWQSNAVFDDFGEKISDWTSPFRMTGEDGLPGTDGETIQFIYRLISNTDNFNELVRYHKESGKALSDLEVPTKIDLLDSKTDEIPVQYWNVIENGPNKGLYTIVDTEWTDEPSGISSDYQIECVCSRTKNEKGKWNEWSYPAIWSKWGEDGTDGPGVEYVYLITPTDDESLIYIPTYQQYLEYDKENDTNYADLFQKDDFIPGKKFAILGEQNWSDEPSDVSPSEPIEWVAIRKKKNGVWGDFSKPVIWNKWVTNGTSFITSYCYTRTDIPLNKYIKEGNITGGNYESAKPNPTVILVEGKEVTITWHDSVPSGNESIWMTSRTFESGDINPDDEGSVDPSWSMPSLMQDRSDFVVEFTTGDPNNPDQKPEPTSLQEFYNKYILGKIADYVADWRSNEEENGISWNDSIENPVWMATSHLKNGEWTDWSVVRIKGETGKKGDDGVCTIIKGQAVVRDCNFTATPQIKQDGKAIKFVIQICNDVHKLFEWNTATKAYDEVENIIVGDSYIVDKNLYVWDGDSFENVGEVQGPQGEKGPAGTNAYFYMAFSNEDSVMDKSTNTTIDPKLKTGKYVGYASRNTKLSDDAQKRSTSYTWSPWQGQDGWGYEQIFLLTKKENGLNWDNGPAVPTDSAAEKDYRPAIDSAYTGIAKGKDGKWSDTPLTPSEDYPFCWIVTRTTNGAEFGAWKGVDGKATLHNRFVVDGAIGGVGTPAYHVELTEDNVTVPLESNSTIDPDFKYFDLVATLYAGEEVIDENVEYFYSFDGNTYKSNSSNRFEIKSEELTNKPSKLYIRIKNNNNYYHKNVTIQYTSRPYEMSVDRMVVRKDWKDGKLVDNDKNVTVTVQLWSKDKWIPAEGTVTCVWTNVEGVTNNLYGDLDEADGTTEFDLSNLVNPATLRFEYGSIFEEVGVVANGEDGNYVEYIYCKRDVYQTPEIPEEWYNDSEYQKPDYYQEPWTDEMSGVDPTYRYEYIAVRERVAGVWGRFSTPKLHSYYAKDATGGGSDGTSGYRVEFIYKLVADESAIDSVEKPSYSNVDKYKPEGWERTPQGVSPSKQVELMCQREKDGDTWGGWSDPAIWAMYGKIGRDGNGVEYIYKLTKNENDLPGTPPSDWSDDPLSVTSTNTVCWVSTRKQYYENDVQKWSDYSTPTIWAKYGKDGKDGGGRTIFVYTISSVYEPSPAIKAPQGGTWNIETNTLSGLASKDSYDWSMNPPAKTETKKYVWQSVGSFNSAGSLVGTWSTPFCITGEDGRDGVDGVSKEFIYRRLPNKASLDTLKEYLSKNALENTATGEVPETKDALWESKWTGDPVGIDGVDYLLEVVCSRKAVVDENGVSSWGAWSTPTMWAMWGEDGNDGAGVEYIFRITEPNATSAGLYAEFEAKGIFGLEEYQKDNFYPGNEWGVDLDWTDEPQDVDKNKPLEWVSIRKFDPKKGTWGKFSMPKIWGKYSKDGYSYKTSYVFARSNEYPGDPKGGDYQHAYPTVDGTPSGERNPIWSDSVPEGDAIIWMSNRTFRSDNDLSVDNDWSTPVKMSDTANFQVEFTATDLSLKPGYKPANFGDFANDSKYTTLEAAEEAWRNAESKEVVWDNDVPNALYMATAVMHDNVWKDWVITKIKGEKGDKGDKGDDGTSVEFKGAFATLTALKAEWNKHISGDETAFGGSLQMGDGYIIETLEEGETSNLYVYSGGTNTDFNASWKGFNIKGDKGDKAVLYIRYSDDGSTFTSENGTTPGKYVGTLIGHGELDSNKINDPDSYKPWHLWNGEDGWGQEQIFLLTTDKYNLQNPPALPDNNVRTPDYHPNHNLGSYAYGTTWLDNPRSVSKEYPYCWVATRKGQSEFGEWQGTNGYASLYSRFSYDGNSAHYLELSEDQIVVPLDGELVDPEFIELYEKTPLTVQMSLYAGDDTIENQATYSITVQPGYATCDTKTGLITLQPAKLNEINEIKCTATYNGKSFTKTLYIHKTNTAYELSVNKSVLRRDPYDENRLVSDDKVVKVTVRRWNGSSWTYPNLTLINAELTKINGDKDKFIETDYVTWHDNVAEFDFSDETDLAKIKFYIDGTDVFEEIGVIANGEDGVSQEYIYIRSKRELNDDEKESLKPNPSNIDSEDFQKPDYCPKSIISLLGYKWTDDSVGVSEEVPYEYVSSRKKKNGKWEAFSKLALWAKYGEKGDKGDTGENAWSWRLSNPISMVSYDNEGNLVGTISETTTVLANCGSKIATVTITGVEYPEGCNGEFENDVFTLKSLKSGKDVNSFTFKIKATGTYSDGNKSHTDSAELLYTVKKWFGEPATVAVHLSNDSTPVPTDSDGKYASAIIRKATLTASSGTTSVDITKVVCALSDSNITAVLNGDELTITVGVNAIWSGDVLTVPIKCTLDGDYPEQTVVMSFYKVKAAKDAEYPDVYDLLVTPTSINVKVDQETGKAVYLDRIITPKIIKYAADNITSTYDVVAFNKLGVGSIEYSFDGYTVKSLTTNTLSVNGKEDADEYVDIILNITGGKTQTERINVSHDPLPNIDWELELTCPDRILYKSDKTTQITNVSNVACKLYRTIGGVKTYVSNSQDYFGFDVELYLDGVKQSSSYVIGNVITLDKFTNSCEFVLVNQGGEGEEDIIWARKLVTKEYAEAGDKGDTGDTGNGIDSIKEFYLASNKSTGITRNTSGWDDDVSTQTLSPTKKYLWNYEQITYTNGSVVETDPCVIGNYSEDGVGISSVTEYYQVNNDSANAPTTWLEVPPKPDANNKYLWNYEKIIFTNGNKHETDPAIIGVYEKGDKGDTGVFSEAEKAALLQQAQNNIDAVQGSLTEAIGDAESRLNNAIKAEKEAREKGIGDLDAAQKELAEASANYAIKKDVSDSLNALEQKYFTGGKIKEGILNEAEVYNLSKAALGINAEVGPDDLAANSVFAQYVVGVVGNYVKIKAEDIEAGTISGVNVKADSGNWELRNDGSATLGSGGIEIKKDGSIQLGSNVEIKWSQVTDHETLDQTITNATNTANIANTNASAANATATTASNKANEAINAANTANTNAQKAQTAAGEAKTTAQTASTVAGEAKSIANTANSRMDDLVDDDVISKADLKTIKDELVYINSDKSDIDNQVSRYSLNNTNVSNLGSSYTNYKGTLESIINTFDDGAEKIDDPNTLANLESYQESYYSNRTTVLNDIAAAAKKVADDAQTAADTAKTIADEAKRKVDNMDISTTVNTAITTKLDQFSIASNKITGNLINGKTFESSTDKQLINGTKYATYSKPQPDGTYTETTQYAGSNSTGPAWQLRDSGEGYLAKGNIRWDDKGNVDFGPGVKLTWDTIKEAVGDNINLPENLNIITIDGNPDEYVYIGTHTIVDSNYDAYEYNHVWLVKTQYDEGYYKTSSGWSTSKNNFDIALTESNEPGIGDQALYGFMNIDGGNDMILEEADSNTITSFKDSSQTGITKADVENVILNTIIDGDSIETGHIKADKIDVNNLTVKKLDTKNGGKGTITILDNAINVLNKSTKDTVVSISGDSFDEDIPTPVIMQTNLRTANIEQNFGIKVGEIDLTDRTGNYKLQLSKTNPYIHYSGGNGDYIARVYWQIIPSTVGFSFKPADGGFVCEDLSAMPNTSGIEPMYQNGSLFYNEYGNSISTIAGKKKYNVYEITYIQKHGASSGLSGIRTSWDGNTESVYCISASLDEPTQTHIKNNGILSITNGGLSFMKYTDSEFEVRIGGYGIGVNANGIWVTTPNMYGGLNKYGGISIDDDGTLKFTEKTTY